MALYQLDRADLNGLLIADNVDPSTRKAVIDLLQDDGYFKDHGSVQVQEGGALDPNTQVLIVDTANTTVVADPALKVIVDLSPNLTVTGASDLFIASADSGAGSDPGKGHGHGHGKGWGLDVDHDHEHGHSTISGGGSGFDTVTSGGGNDLHGLFGSNDGHDTVFGGTGGNTPLGHSLTNAAIDTVSGSFGNDTTSGGASHQPALFDVGSGGHGVSTDHGVTTVQFAGGQTTTISGVEQLVFTDQHVKH